MEPRDGITVLYTLASLCALASCWLWFSNAKPTQANHTAAALAFGFAGGGFLLSLFI